MQVSPRCGFHPLIKELAEKGANDGQTDLVDAATSSAFADTGAYPRLRTHSTEGQPIFQQQQPPVTLPQASISSASLTSSIGGTSTPTSPLASHGSMKRSGSQGVPLSVFEKRIMTKPRMTGDSSSQGHGSIDNLVAGSPALSLSELGGDTEYKRLSQIFPGGYLIKMPRRSGLGQSWHLSTSPCTGSYRIIVVCSAKNHVDFSYQTSCNLSRLKVSHVK